MTTWPVLRATELILWSCFSTVRNTTQSSMTPTYFWAQEATLKHKVSRRLIPIRRTRLWSNTGNYRAPTFKTMIFKETSPKPVNPLHLPFAILIPPYQPDEQSSRTDAFPWQSLELNEAENSGSRSGNCSVRENCTILSVCSVPPPFPFSLDPVSMQNKFFPFESLLLSSLGCQNFWLNPKSRYQVS